jgi:hypothetical protein
MRRIKWLYYELRYVLTGRKFKVVLSEEAKKDVEILTKEEKKELDKVIKKLSKNPFSGKIIKCPDCKSEEIEITEDGFCYCTECGLVFE